MGFVNILIINRLFQSFCVKKKSDEGKIEGELHDAPAFAKATKV